MEPAPDAEIKVLATPDWQWGILKYTAGSTKERFVVLHSEAKRPKGGSVVSITDLNKGFNLNLAEGVPPARTLRQRWSGRSQLGSKADARDDCWMGWFSS
jgi:hypothetical protein